MKNKRLFLKTFGVLASVFGISLFSTSCAKERTCECSYTYGPFSIEVFEVTAKDKCEDLEFADGENDDVDFDGEDIECEEK